VRNATILAPGGFVSGAWLLASQGLILALGPRKLRLPRGADLEIDAAGRHLLPGFIDLHAHGGGGGAVNDAKPESILKILAGHARHGTTSLLVTTFPDTPRRLRKTVEAIARAGEKHPALLGIHLEGPHLSARKTGALAPGKLRPLSPQEVDELNEACGGLIRMITVAPEIDGAVELIRHCRRRGIVTAIAHTAATYEQAKTAFDAGMTHAVHVPNTFVFPKNARSPGALEAVYLDDRVTAQLIPDPEIVSEQFMRMVLRLKGLTRVVLITDAMRPAGLPGVSGPIRNSANTIVGSTMTMSQALRNIVKLGIPLEAGAAMSSIQPARVLSLDGIKGSLEVGKHADFVIVSKRLDCLMTVSQGRILYLSKALLPRRTLRTQRKK
jgi:N-acetylglucosamine-6-phosphate deacetylase